MKKALALIFASLLVTAPLSAQTTVAPNKATSASPVAKSAKPQRTAKSLDCSKQADAKNVHGKERRKFMSSCKKG